MSNPNFSLFELNHIRLAARKHSCVRHHATHALEKVADVTPCLETDKIKLEQCAQESPLWRQFRKNIVRREWNVQEKCSCRQNSRSASFPQRLGHVHQVII